MRLNVSIVLAITYMDWSLSYNICRSCAFFTRHVYGILILTSVPYEANRIPMMFKNMDVNITFTIEKPGNARAHSLVIFKLKIRRDPH